MIKTWLKNSVSLIMIALGLGATAGTGASLLGSLHWMLDVLSSFHIQYTAMLLVSLLGVLLVKRQRRLGLIFLIALLINLYLIAPFFIAEKAIVENGSTPLRVMSLNISTATTGYPQVVELIREREPDIIFLSEVRDDLVALLEAELSDLYPLQYAKASRFTLGVAVLARDPNVRVSLMQADANMGRMRRIYLQAEFEWAETAVSLAGIHPLPPMRGDWAYGRDREIGVLGQLANATDHPFIMVGDLNATPWSHAMKSLKQDTNLRYARAGYGIKPTWFLGGRYLGTVLGAPIDHILVSPEWSVIDYTEAGDIGSDHAPVQADIVLK